MAKKQLTATQKKNKYRAIQYSTFASEFLAILTPYIVMGGVNYEEWFKSEEGWRIGLGGSLALVLMGLAIFLVTKNKEDKKVTSGYITLIIGWFAVAFVFMLLANIMDQIAMIMLYGGIGLIVAFGLDLTSKKYKEKADAYANALNKAKGTTIEEEAMKEVARENRPVD